MKQREKKKRNSWRKAENQDRNKNGCKKEAINNNVHRIQSGAKFISIIPLIFDYY